MKKATFLNAKDGKIEVTYRDTTGLTKTVTVGTTMEIALLATYVDFSESMCSSSMDFADEYGFAFPSAAWDLLNRGLESQLEIA